ARAGDHAGGGVDPPRASQEIEPRRLMATLTRRDLLLAAPAVALVGGCRGNGPDPDSLDPHKARSVEAMVVLRDLFECLTRISRDGAPSSAAAAHWSVSADGTVYT